MSNIKDQKLISTYGQKVLDSGFHSIPNLILDHQRELNLTDKELLFFIKVTHFFKKKFITDNELNMESSRVTLFRIRKNLIEKGYLELKTLYDQSDNGHIKGIGTCYDWTGLITALNNLPMFQNETDVSICYADVQNETPSIKMKHIIGNKGKECIVKESIVKEDKKPNGFSNPNIKLFQQQWIENYPGKYVVSSYPKWGKQLQNLFKAVEPIYNGQAYEKLIECMQRYFKSKKKWHVESNYSFDVFMSDLNTFVNSKTDKNGIQEFSEAGG